MHPDRWGTGLAREGVELAVAAIRAAGRTPVLWVLVANHRARGLYEHLGWEPTGREQPAEWPPYPRSSSCACQNPPMAAELLEIADELYALTLPDFTPARDAKAKELKGTDLAKEVKALKKPSWPAGSSTCWCATRPTRSSRCSRSARRCGRRRSRCPATSCAS